MANNRSIHIQFHLIDRATGKPETEPWDGEREVMCIYKEYPNGYYNPPVISQKVRCIYMNVNITFETMEDAQNYPHTYFGVAKDAYEVRRWRNKEWRDREQKRLTGNDAYSERYTPVPWFADESPTVLTPIVDHFVHISADPGLIAYTTDEGKGELDIQTKMKPGRYLTKYYPNLTNDEVNALAVLVDKANEVRFATTQDEIEAVYVNGPRSCMSHKTHGFESHIHPTRVYASGDLAIAYLGTKDRATARVLCWPDEKRYGRIYGDAARLIPLLKERGYKESSLSGARILKIENQEGDGYVMPYLDSPTDMFTDEGDYFALSQYDGYCGKSTSGYTTLNPRYEITCDNCEEGMCQDDSHQVITSFTSWAGRYNTGFYCASCYENRTFFCAGHLEAVSDNLDAIETKDTGETYSKNYASHNLFWSDEVGGYYVDADEAPENQQEDETAEEDA